jgi:hypothetical protein
MLMYSINFIKQLFFSNASNYLNANFTFRESLILLLKRNISNGLYYINFILKY